MVLRRRLRRWRVLGVLASLMVLAAAGLVGAWKFVPDRLPPMLHPIELIRLIGGAPAPQQPPQRRRAPPESQFDE